jgi:hypothetical protein
MVIALGLILAFQAGQPDARRMVDSITREVTRRATERARRAREGRSIVEARVVTPEHLATAFKDPASRTLLLRARRARLEQDSLLTSYDASSYQRISAGLSFSKLGRDRLVFRTEQAGRIRWQRDVGMWVDITGSRTVLPGIPEIGEREAKKGIASAGEMVPIPYYPGYERLWAGTDVVRSHVDENGPVHPLAEGAEAYYTYATGDSLSIKLPDARVVRLRSLVIRPREPKWNVIVGTLWFDLESAQLVRAGYRFAVPMQIDAFVLEQDPTAFDDVPAWIKPLMMPMHGEVSAITVEYGMYGGRFWLPRMRSAEGTGQASFVRVPFKIEQSFKYASVNGRDSLPSIPRFGWRSRIRCDSTDHRISDTRRYFDDRIAMAVRTPCSPATLETSPDLPKSIYEPGEQVFDLSAHDALIREALSMSAQPPLTLNPSKLPKPILAYGPQLIRYNRVEGFSVGLGVTQILGGGYTVDGVGRIGTGDQRPNAELTITRSNLSRAIYVSGYTGLVSAREWGNPLSFGSSVASLLFGRDEGFYYRSTGAALGVRRERGTPFDWRVFAERHRTAPLETDFSVLGSNAAPNITATEGTYLGGAVRYRPSFGIDPQGFRLFGDLRLEAASSDSAYGRASLDLSLTKGFGAVAGAVTLSSGSSVGALPAHRRWYLGGTHTVRGQSPDTASSGSAFWMTRAELGRTIYGPRVTIFGDLGWAGDRTRWSEVGRPLSGAGAGISLLDGLIRFDVARGIYPRQQWRVDMYIEGVF